VPKQAITMGMGAIMKSKKIVLIATEDDKADIVRKAFLGQIRTDIPASLLRLHSQVTVVLDPAASAMMPAVSKGVDYDVSAARK
jgi:glucosamine-6-phosphate deaminase